jgi:hypothetical protein
MAFATDITLTGPFRSPAQMLQHQEVDGHASVHDAGEASALGLAGAPIEGRPTSARSTRSPRACGAMRGSPSGCISSHFRTMVVEGEQVQASLTTSAGRSAVVEAHKADGTPVLSGTASIGPDHPETELEARLAAQRDPGELFVVDRLEVGMRRGRRRGDHDRRRTERSQLPLLPGREAGPDHRAAPLVHTPRWVPRRPGGRAVVPIEMISVLANRSGAGWPVRSPAMGLFLDLEIRLLDGPVLVGQRYAVEREVVGLSSSRRTESYWTRTVLTDVGPAGRRLPVLLHSGVFKESYPGYPKDRL